MTTTEEILAGDDKSRYMLLGRMQADCKYCIENNHTKHLWASSPEKQIECMKALWNSFSEKPQWLSMEDIEEFEEQLLEVKSRNEKESREAMERRFLLVWHRRLYPIRPLS